MSNQGGCTATAMKAEQFMTNLPNPFLGQASSLIFIKKMTAIAVSAIVYARNIFAEKDFGVRDVGGISVKILRGGKKRCPGAGCLVQWLEGVYDAIDKQYLQNLYLEITSNQSAMTLERYTLKFAYTSNEITCSLKDGSNTISITPTQMENTADAVRSLLRNIFGITTSLQLLPRDTSLCMKLQYTDGTPPDYEPEGFKPSDQDAVSTFESKPSTWRLGNVSTPFHNLMVKCYVTPYNADSSSHLNSVPLEKVESSAVEPKSSSQEIIPLSEEPFKKPLKGKGKSLEVKCLCGQSDKAGIMLQCQDCGMLQHAVCYGVLKKEDVPLRHVCFHCHSEGNPCSDITLLTKSKEERMDTCLYRRVLLVCTHMPRLSLSKLSQELNVDVTSAITFMRRLHRDKAFKQCLQTPSLGRPKFSFPIDDAHVHKVLIPLHFNKTGDTKEDEPLNQKRPNLASTKSQKEMLRKSDANHKECPGGKRRKV